MKKTVLLMLLMLTPALLLTGCGSAADSTEPLVGEDTEGDSFVTEEEAAGEGGGDEEGADADNFE